MKHRTQTLPRSSLLAHKSVYTAYAADAHTLPIWHVTYNADNKRAQSPSRRRGATAILRLARGLTSARARSGIPRHSGNCYRPILFSNATTVVEMAYDYMGRRFEYKETVSGTLTRHERYLYRGYLQIAALDMLNSASVKHTIAWDPSEPTATRPLSLQIGANAYYYAFDQVKNVTELFDSTGALAATYDYSPFGQVVASTNNVSNPLTFSSEIHDSSLGLQYYNYRHLNTLDGRWVSRDLIHEEAWENLYGICANNTVKYLDLLGNDWYKKPKDNSHSTGNADDDANNCRGNGPVSSCVVRRVCAKGKKEFKDTFYRPCWLNINGKECVGLEKCRNYIICQEYSIGTSPDPRYTGTMWVNSALPECSECKKTL